MHKPLYGVSARFQIIHFAMAETYSVTSFHSLGSLRCCVALTMADHGLNLG